MITKEQVEAARAEYMQAMNDATEVCNRMMAAGDKYRTLDAQWISQGLQERGEEAARSETEE